MKNKEQPPHIECSVHGYQQETFVCQHIASGLSDRSRVGFWWSAEDTENPRPDAWCTECENRVRAVGGEWVGEAERHLGIRILCGACYDAARIFHMGGDPWQ
jgi:hypothetical protein